jgi:hypothetical protein
VGARGARAVSCQLSACQETTTGHPSSIIHHPYTLPPSLISHLSSPSSSLHPSHTVLGHFPSYSFPLALTLAPPLPPPTHPHHTPTLIPSFHPGLSIPIQPPTSSTLPAFILLQCHLNSTPIRHTLVLGLLSGTFCPPLPPWPRSHPHSLTSTVKHRINSLSTTLHHMLSKSFPTLVTPHLTLHPRTSFAFCPLELASPNLSA